MHQQGFQLKPMVQKHKSTIKALTKSINSKLRVKSYHNTRRNPRIEDEDEGDKMMVVVWNSKRRTDTCFQYLPSSNDHSISLKNTREIKNFPSPLPLSLPRELQVSACDFFHLRVK